MIKHEERREKELSQEFEHWLYNCDKNDLLNLIGQDKLKEIWLADRLRRIKNGG